MNVQIKDEDKPILFQILLSECVKEKKNTLLILPENFKYEQFIIYLSRYFGEKSDKQTLFIVQDIAENLNYAKFIAKMNIPFLSSKKPIDKRAAFYKSSKILMVTAQVLRNDLLRELIKVSDIGLAVFLQVQKGKGLDLHSQLADIFLIASEVKIIGFTRSNITNLEDFVEIIRALKITNVYYRNKADTLIRRCLERKSEKALIIPLDQQLNQLVVDLRTLERKINFLLKESGIDNPYALRKNFKKRIEKLKNSDITHEQIEKLVQLAKESFFLRSLIETIESSPIEVSLKFLEKNSEKIVQYSFSNSLFEILSEIEEQKNKIHPKTEKIIEEIQKINNSTDSKVKNSSIFIYARNKLSLELLSARLTDVNLSNSILTSRTVKQIKELEKFEKKQYQILLASTSIPIQTEYTFIYSLPRQKGLFFELIKRKNSKCLITHRSIEEKIYYSWMKQEKKEEKGIEELIKHEKVKETLLLNQQELFNRQMEQMINPRTKVLLQFSQIFEKKKEKTIEKIQANNRIEPETEKEIHRGKEVEVKDKSEKKQVKESMQKKRKKRKGEELSLICFFTGCTMEEAMKIKGVSEKLGKSLFEIKKEELEHIFEKERAEEIRKKIKKRVNLL